MSTTFTHRNEGFTCESCGAIVPDAQGTCRNHCTQCLCSKHVDIHPGDRSNTCQGTMRPIDIIIKGGSMVSILHKCDKCNHEGRNKIAPDDDRDRLIEIMQKSTEKKMR